jgi:hypothetical protein
VTADQWTSGEGPEADAASTGAGGGAAQSAPEGAADAAVAAAPEPVAAQATSGDVVANVAAEGEASA